MASLLSPWLKPAVQKALEYLISQDKALNGPVNRRAKLEYSGELIIIVPHVGLELRLVETI